MQYNYIIQTPQGTLLATTREEAKRACAQFSAGSFRVQSIFKNPDEVEIPKDIPKKYNNVCRTWVSIQLRLGNTSAISRKTQHALEVYFNILGQGLGKLLEKRNIMDISSPQRLENIVEAACNQYLEHNAKKTDRSTRVNLLDYLVKETDDWLLFEARTKGVAILLGKNTEWCTAARGLPYYEEYTKKAPLWVFVNKKDPSEKYQIFIPKDLSDLQVKDVQDEDVNLVPGSIAWPLLEIMYDVYPESRRLYMYRTGNESDRFLDRDTKENLGISISTSAPQVGTYVLSKDSQGYVATYRGYGVVSYYLNGNLHKESGPAVVKDNGDIEWWQHGKLHREDGPAIVLSNGLTAWRRHREDGPELATKGGTQYWYKHGKLHREDGPAIVFANSEKEWWFDGFRHREDGPAVEAVNGDREWWTHGVFQRSEGRHEKKQK